MVDLSFTGERIVPGLTPERVFREHQMRYRFAAEFVRDQVVLDVASGSGIGTYFLRQSGAKACLGLELDRSAALFAAATYPSCTFVRSDAGKMCLADAVVDVVVSFETIEHLQEPVKFLAECHRVLRPGGLLICSTPNHSVYGLWDANPFHVHEMNLEEFQDSIQSLFGDCQLYGQLEVNYPIYVSRWLIVKFLDRIRLREPIKKVLGRKDQGVAAETEFSKNHLLPEFEVKRITPKRLVRPTYFVAVARKKT